MRCNALIGFVVLGYVYRSVSPNSRRELGLFIEGIRYRLREDKIIYLSVCRMLFLAMPSFQVIARQKDLYLLLPVRG